MLVNDAVTISPGCEVFQRKLESGNGVEVVEKVRIREISNDSALGLTEVEDATHSPKVVFLLETERSAIEMKVIKNQLGDFEGWYVDAHSRAGCVAMLWAKSVDLNFLSSSMHHTDVSIQWTNHEPQWHFTELYGWHKKQLKLRMGELVEDLKTHSALPWLVERELNEIFYHSDKKGGPAKPQTLIDNFRNSFLDNDLYDLDYSSYDFTWEVVEERLDSDISNHIPILLKCASRLDYGGKPKKLFRFENMWVTSVDCENVIDQVWGSGPAGDVIDDKLIRYCTSNGLFTVRSTYHLIMESKRDDGCPTDKCNLARRMAAVGMSCAICGSMEKLNIHILLECPFAKLVWEANDRPSGLLKLNLDGGKVGESGWGWGFALQNCDGDVLMSGVKQGAGFVNADLEEARSCLFTLQCIREERHDVLIMEGDYLQLIQKLRSKISQGLTCVESFSYLSWAYVKRGGNQVAYELAHWQPFSLDRRLWVDDVPSSVASRA
ncbi:hypothetical protein Cgig2_002373 [Carnegiea gigantea]|uniref:RNase H type-1 domain-containing protein n=1 Tax=Carnegiea gigantea TaxID=171969 RepID=A0A9Q1QC62_9CARY|nr:hypothetical protein Cgig2_002373 [Carnegiea gigantea]